MVLPLLQASTPQELGRLIDGRSDHEIAQAVTSAGIDHALDHVFAGMVNRYVGSRGPRRRAVVEFVVLSDAGPRVRQFVARPEGPSWHGDVRERADVRVELRIADFLRLVSGRLHAVAAFAQKKLKVRGNYFMASGIQSWFDFSS
jgi:hypothetical protein